MTNGFNSTVPQGKLEYRGIIPLFKLLIKQNFMDIQNALDIINTEQLKGTAVLSVYALKGIVGYAASQNKPVEELSPMEIVEAIKLVDLTVPQQSI
ncbi:MULTISPECIES: hypothetical protein [Nostocales]|jgi:hypothetical protein|uniref:Uncharacterized protein n=2 Tax=Aphanizomenon flos-aquae TaxID=1176 RepID=A0ABR8BUY9_APHFL|nr:MULTISPECIES: hypothetical protein [Nostocales]MBO1068556.1 hypothetical protein [Dolichospermum sp. DEX189]MCX5980757.1 hypothetical protein [Nostocales cyanobacterium LacPavin_0920_SED1_MAG_38_18]ALB41641.1 hypothetical protein AA650_15280 [Anabaena sp. WA102]MBD2278246.1 hypothetical protein [Aphanizomenon flos-aquae FACHB-1040]OBQ16282.1 MAG: hypothetical protein AN486_19615 [Anabaena sp. AL93]